MKPSGARRVVGPAGLSCVHEAAAEAIAPRKVRSFYCGEYGELFGRPHYHACLFGYRPADCRVWSRRGDYDVYRSVELETLWTEGLSEVGSLTFDSAAYVARYVLKKVRGEAAMDHYLAVDAETGEVFARPRSLLG